LRRIARVVVWLLFCVSILGLVPSGAIAADNTSGVTAADNTSPPSTLTETHDGVAFGLVPIQASEIPPFPAIGAGTRPNPIGPYDSATTPGNLVVLHRRPPDWLHAPDGSYKGLSDPATCTPQITVTGKLYARDGSGVVRPMSWASVWIFDVDLDINFNQPFPNEMGIVLAGDDGSFSAGPFCNQDGTDTSNRKDIMVVAVSLSSAAQVLRYYIFGPWQWDPYVYSGWTSQFDNAASGTLDVGRWVVPENTRAADAFAAYGIWSGVLAGWDLVRNRVSPTYAPPKVEVHYPRPYCDFPLPPPEFGWYSADCPNLEPFPHYMVPGSKCGWLRPDDPWTVLDSPHSGDCADHWDDFDWQIHLDSLASARNPFVVNHLYGHYIMQRKYGGGYPSNGANPASSSRFAGDFDENGNCGGVTPSYELYCELRLTANYSSHDSSFGRQIAWAEGLADAFALRALATRPGGQVTDVFAFTRSTGEVWSVAFETTAPSSSQHIEHPVTATLWDLADSWTDGLDDYAGSFDSVWKAFLHARANTLREFWDNWRAALHLEAFRAREALAQNGFVTSRSTLRTPTASDVGPNYVHLCWTTTNPTDLSKIEVHKSTTANFVPSTATLWTTIIDTRTCQDVTGLSPGVTYYFELITYGRSAFPANSNQVSATPGQPPSTIEGYVKDSGGSAINGAVVTIKRPSGSTSTATTNSNGFYSFTVNALGYHLVWAVASGYTPTSCGNWLNVDQYGTVYPLNFTLRSGTGIAPICVDNIVVEGVRVTVTNSTGHEVYSALTDANGMVLGKMGLAPGTYTVRASWTGFGGCRYSGIMYVTIPPGQGPTIEMQYAGGGDKCPV
jgi:hypothetical protein